jgi:hypothetical protein
MSIPYFQAPEEKEEKKTQSICRKSQIEHTYAMLHHTVYTSMPSIKYPKSIAYTDMCRDKSSPYRSTKMGVKEGGIE